MVAKNPDIQKNTSTDQYPEYTSIFIIPPYSAISKIYS